MTYVKEKKFCCVMRARFLVGIVAVDQEVVVPDTDLADHVIDWNPKQGGILLGLSYCPFCGEKQDWNKAPMRDQRTGE